MTKIAEIQTIVFRLPMKGALSWGQSSRMDALEHVLVRLVTDGGHEGWAEAPPRPTIYGETPQSVEAIIRHHLAPRLIGRSIEDVEGFNRVLHTIANNHAAKGALDICLHEALAASRGQSLRDYLDPPHHRIKVSYILGIAAPEIMLAEARAVYKQGVRVLKVKVGRDIAHDVALIETLNREFAGSGLSLYADANEGLRPAEAEAHLCRLAELGLLYVEEPLPVTLLSERAALRASDTLALIADDSAFTLADLQRELTFNTFDILNIKTARTGYTTSRHMLDLALRHGKGVMVGSQASAGLGTIRAALFAGLAGIDHPSELSFFLKLEDDLITRPLELRDGYLDLDSLTGITVDADRLRALAG